VQPQLKTRDMIEPMYNFDVLVVNQCDVFSFFYDILKAAATWLDIHVEEF
jgi:hypothetical protein